MLSTFLIVVVLIYFSFILFSTNFDITEISNFCPGPSCFKMGLKMQCLRQSGNRNDKQKSDRIPFCNKVLFQLHIVYFQINKHVSKMFHDGRQVLSKWAIFQPLIGFRRVIVHLNFVTILNKFCSVCSS